MILCAYICYCIHWSLGDVFLAWAVQDFGEPLRFHHGDGDYQARARVDVVCAALEHQKPQELRCQLFSDNFMEQVTNVSGIQEEDKEDSS